MAREGMHPPALSAPSGCCQHEAVIAEASRHSTQDSPHTVSAPPPHTHACICASLQTPARGHTPALVAGTHTVQLWVLTIVATVWFCTITTALLHCSTSTYAQCTTSTTHECTAQCTTSATQVIGSVYTAQATLSHTHSSSSCVAAGTQLQLSHVRRMCQEGHSNQWRPCSHLHGCVCGHNTCECAMWQTQVQEHTPKCHQPINSMRAVDSSNFSSMCATKEASHKPAKNTALAPSHPGASSWQPETVRRHTQAQTNTHCPKATHTHRRRPTHHPEQTACHHGSA